MNGLMMDMPLLISDLIKHADRNHGDTEIVSKTVEGAGKDGTGDGKDGTSAVHRYNFREAHARDLVLRRLRLQTHARQLHALLLLERAKPPLLQLLLLAIVANPPLQHHKPVALQCHLIPELLDAAHERSISQRQQVQVLVAGHELTERGRREQRLRRIQRPTLVDVHEPPP